jgi:hypothetical protein
MTAAGVSAGIARTISEADKPARSVGAELTPVARQHPEALDLTG